MTVQDLERIARRIVVATNALVSLDGRERWGMSGASAADFEAHGREVGEQLSLQSAARAELTAAIRAATPEVIAAWVDAHVQYLTEFLAETTDDTAKFVARGELEAWKKLAPGGPLVDENGYYVAVNSERYRRIFGIDP